MDAKKTRIPMGATRALGARTIVMDRPPEMTIELGPESEDEVLPVRPAGPRPSKTPSMMVTSIFKIKARTQRTSPSPRPPLPSPSRPPPIPRVAPPPVPLPRAAPPRPRQATVELPAAPDANPSIAPPGPPRAPLRTRMVDLRDALERPLPPLPTHLASPSAQSFSSPPAQGFVPCPVSGFVAKTTAEPRWQDRLPARWPLVAMAAGVLLLLVLVPLLLGEGGAQAQAADPVAANTQAPIAVPPSQEATAAPRPTTSTAKSLPPPVQAKAEMVHPASAISEAKAGAALLSGRRAEALILYRALAQQPGASEGVTTMVRVLEQKVTQP